MDAWHDLDRRFLVKYGIFNEENLYAMENASTIEYAADYLIGKGFPKEREEIIDEIRGMIEDAYRNRLQLFPGVVEFLVSRRAAGWKLGLLTAAPGPLVMAALERLRIAEFFDHIICDANKHGDGPFLAMDEAIGLPREEVVVIDDQDWVLARAAELGFKTEAKIEAYA